MMSSTFLRCSISSRSAGPTRSACRRRFDFIMRLRPARMFSSTVMPLKSARLWKVRAMPRAAAWCGSMALRVSPRNVMRPCCGR